MKVRHYEQVEGKEAAPGVTMRIVAGPDDGAPGFVMRVFEIQPGSATPTHTHPWEHEVFILHGNGVLKSAGADRPLKEGDAVLVLPGELHGFANESGAMFRIICVVPLVDGRMPGMTVS